MSPAPEVLLSMRNAYEDKTDSASFMMIPKLKNKGHNSSKKNSEKAVYGAIELD